MLNIAPGDKVINIHSEELGEVINTYPEINVAIVKTAHGTFKVKFNDLMVLRCETDSDVENKKQSLLDKVKSKFSGRYD